MLHASRCLVTSRAHHTDRELASSGAALRSPEACRLLQWHFKTSSGRQPRLCSRSISCDPLIARGPRLVGAALLAGLDARNRRRWCVVVEDKGDWPASWVRCALQCPPACLVCLTLSWASPLAADRMHFERAAYCTGATLYLLGLRRACGAVPLPELRNGAASWRHPPAGAKPA